MRWETHKDQVGRIHEQLLSLGVLHTDVRHANVLWNERLQQVMFIDLTRSIRIPPLKPKLLEFTPPPDMKTKALQSSPLVVNNVIMLKPLSRETKELKRSLSESDMRDIECDRDASRRPRLRTVE